MIKRKKRRLAPVPKADKNLTFSYKDVEPLYRYLTGQGNIVARPKTGLSQKQQRRLVTAIKRARHLSMLPFTQTL